MVAVGLSTPSSSTSSTSVGVSVGAGGGSEFRNKDPTNSNAITTATPPNKRKRWFAACRDALENDLDFDYDGPSGVTELVVRQGDPKRARFQEFRFDDTGRDVPGTSWIVEV
jgi:hypothetical protein